jgi:hypothetical protein
MNPGSTARQVALITAGAAVLLGVVLFLLPGGSDLTPMDFIADRRSVLQFCDPENFRPLPAAQGRPAVTLAQEGVRTAFTLTTVSGRPIGARDLLPRGHPVVRVLVSGPSGGAALAAEAEPGRRKGEWLLNLGAAKAGSYQVRATFMPEATGRETEARAEIVVAARQPR